jgi:DNA-binding response OmpR family regulator
MSLPNEQMAHSDIDVAGCRVLVVEDETLIAVLIEETLVAMECKILGPAAKLETALQLAREGGFDIAILDVTVRGGKVYPVAEELLARGIPFVLASGYGDWALPNALRDQRRLLKPFTPAMLEQEVRVLYSKAAERKAKQ